MGNGFVKLRDYEHLGETLFINVEQIEMVKDCGTSEDDEPLTEIVMISHSSSYIVYGKVEEVMMMIILAQRGD